MRKIMLAATAIVGFTGLTAGIANAQMPNQPIVSDSFGLNGQGGDFPAPGTVTVRFRARVLTEIGYGTDSGQVGKGLNGKPNGSKNGGFYQGTAMRLYPGVDGTLANGIKYGGAIEIRANNGGTSGSASNTLYVRRASLYFSGGFGKVLLGQIDGALSQLYNIGAIEGADYTGGVNGSNSFANGNTVPTWPFWENGGSYVNSKMVYLTPNFYGIDAGVSYEATQTTGDTNCGQASATGCPTQTSVPGNVNVRRNTVEAAARYKGSLGPVAVNALVGYVGAGKVNNSTATATTVKLSNLSVFDAGLTLAYAGITVGGHYIGGAMNPVFNGGYGMKFNGQKNLQAFIVGAAYQTGPFTVGSYFQNQWSGGYYNVATPTNSNTLHESSISVGGAWDWAPGSTAYISAVYGKRHQANADLLNGVAAVGANNTGVQSRWLVVGNVFRW